MRLDDNIIDTPEEYFEVSTIDPEIDWDETGNEELISMEEYNLVGEILATQVSFWALRRMRNSCGSNCDIIRSIMKSKISEYESKFGKFNDLNEDNIW
jgi:hypothetical protein